MPNAKLLSCSFKKIEDGQPCIDEVGDIRCALQELISFPTLMMFLMDYSFVLRASYFFAVLAALAAHSARKCMQAACIRQHSTSTVHRVAENHFLCPDRNVSELAPYNLQEQGLYRGNVPQARDWLRAWNSCQTAASFIRIFQAYLPYVKNNKSAFQKHFKSILFLHFKTICFGTLHPKCISKAFQFSCSPSAEC